MANNCENEDGPLGHLQMCVDKRFVHRLMAQFEKETGVKKYNYWTHTDAGGTPKMESSKTSPDYAYSQGARIMAWCAHGANCGGYGGEPAGVPDHVIQQELEKTFHSKAYQYPLATHYAFFITQKKDKKGNCTYPIVKLGPLKIGTGDWEEVKS